MITGEDIRQAIRNIVAQYLVTSKLREPKLCTVLKVSAGLTDGLMTCDCQPVDGTAVVEDVKLIAYYNNNQAGFILVPKVNSLVQISFNDDCDAFVSMVSVVDFIYLNGNDYGGLVQVQPLVDKINVLENNLNAVLNALNGITVTIPSGGGTFPLATYFSAISQITPTTQKSDLENTTVLHGTGNLG